MAERPKRDSPLAWFHSRRGLAAYERGDVDVAERELRRADELGGAWGAFRLGFLLEERGDHAGAEAAYRRAVERGSPSAASNLGVLLENRGELDEAEAFYRLALERGNDSARRGLARIDARRAVAARQQQSRQGQSPVASVRRTALGSPAGSPVGPAQAMFLMGEYHAWQGDDEQARGAWISCISTGDAEWAPKAGVALGELLRRNDEPDSAEQVLRQVVDTGTGRPVVQARLVLGVLAADRGDVDGALAAYEAVIAAGDPELVPVAWFDIGRLRQQSGDADAATEAYLTAMASRHPDIAPRAAVNLGVVRFAAGDWDGAREAFGLAARSGHPEQAQMAARNLAALRAVHGDTDEVARLMAQADAFDAAPHRTDLQLAQDHHAAAKELREQSQQARRDGHPPAEVGELASAALQHATSAFAAFERAAGTGATVPEVMEEMCFCAVHLDDVTPGPPDIQTLRMVANRLRQLRDGGHLSPEGRQLLNRLEGPGQA